MGPTRQPHCASEFLSCVLLLLASIVIVGCGPERTLPADSAPGTALASTAGKEPSITQHWQGEMVGEVTQDSAILQARLTEDGKIRAGDVAGRPGVGVFELSTDSGFQEAVRTARMHASAANDYLVKSKATGLKAGTRYHYRLLSGPDIDSLVAGPAGTFRTLDPEGVAREVSFVTVTGMNRFAFRAESLKDLAFEDRTLGFPALVAIRAREPDFFVATGDNVYYDTPFIGRAKTREQMRAKWHRQFATPRFAALFLQVPTYWEKDDHDYRYEDSDPHGPYAPSGELGSQVFREQVPVVDPANAAAPTYRTHRVNDLLQIWLLEGRDHRDANVTPPSPDKTLWGKGQKVWLKETLLASDATFKIIISPTPLVGPDDTMKGVQGGLLAPYFGGRPLGQGEDMNKRDNHINVLGFRDEGNAFFAWLVDHGFLEKNLYILTGDRHWQYHSIHPSGFEEFSTGALVDGNARLGPKPGDPTSTDPEELIVQPYSQAEPSGGFLQVTVRPPEGVEPAKAEFVFYDEHGVILHHAERAANR